MIFISKLTMRYGAKILYQNVQLQLNPGCRYGLVGANGCGKSTLIQILTGEITPDSGEITIPSLVKLGALSQNHFIYEETAILDVVLMGNEKLYKALSDKEALLQSEHFTEAECDRLEALEKIIADEDGYAAPSVAANLLEGLDIEAEKHLQPMKVLSGGYKLRVLLAQVLFKKPCVLLLDEPTNHLDLFSIQWLEEYLKNYPGTLLISSHDQDFLNGVCNYIADVDHQTIKLYKGNYDQFIEAKAADLEQKASQLENQEKKREDLQQFVDRFRAKSSKATQAQSKLKLVEKLEEEMEGLKIAPSSRMYPKLSFDQVRPSAQIVLKVNGLAKSYGTREVLKNVSFEIEKGERVAFLGANGIGKSTLLEIVTGNRPADTGNYAFGLNTFVSYFPQDHKREVNKPSTLLDWLSSHDSLAPEQRLREILARVLFTQDDVKKKTNILSGGETARLILAKMMLVKHNILIFDEPTNHLDMEATEKLLEALEGYPGTILFVSHNRRFVSRLATRIIELTSTGLNEFQGTYAEFAAKRNQDLLSLKKPSNRHDKPQSTEKDRYLEKKSTQKDKSQNERKIKQLEDKCQSLEIKIKEIDIKLSAPDYFAKTPAEEQKKAILHKETLEKDLENALAEWEIASNNS